VVGNKTDMAEHKQEVTEKDACAVAEKFSMEHVRTSAKTSQNVNELFEKMGRDLMRIHADSPYTPTGPGGLPRPLPPSHNVSTFPSFCSC
jgi:GTPase SAR1 family protein